MLRTLLKTRVAPNQFVRFASAAPSATAVSNASSTPISTPTLRKLENRWEKLPEDDKEEIIGLLAERQKGDWKELTPLEKKAAWYISYGEWGPRRPVHAKGDVQRIFLGTLTGVAAAFLLFVSIRAFLPNKPKTMAQEWEQAEIDQLDEIQAEPFTGHNMIQSPPTGISASDADEDDDE